MCWVVITMEHCDNLVFLCFVFWTVRKDIDMVSKLQIVKNKHPHCSVFGISHIVYSNLGKKLNLCGCKIWYSFFLIYFSLILSCPLAQNQTMNFEKSLASVFKGIAEF